MGTRGVRPPDPHPSGVKPPDIPPDLVPRHVALVMDGDGRWAGKRGLPRTEGHKQGESSLLDVIMGAIVHPAQSQAPGAGRVIRNVARAAPP